MTQGKIEAAASASVGKAPSGVVPIRERGVFQFVVRGADGEIKQTMNSENALTVEGANRILDGWSTLASAETPFIGLISNTGFSALAEGNTMAGVHNEGDSGTNGWAEIATAGSYTYARLAWGPAVAASGEMAGTTSSFLFTGLSGTKVVKGAFLCNVLTTSTGKLIATSQFTGSGTITLGATDSLTIAFTLSLT